MRELASGSAWAVGVLLLAVWAQRMPASAPATRPAARKKPLRETVGVTHVAGKYHLTRKDFLNEGADEILALGSRVIKLYLFKPSTNYPFNTRWPRVSSLVELARARPYAAVFAKPFKTYILTTYSLGRREHYWIEGVTKSQKADETRQFHELAKHLLVTYRGTGKTFVLQHWEGDWAARGNFNAKADPKPVAFKGMIEWLNARQEGVSRARAEVGQKGVRVYHAAEVNRVVASMRKGRPGVVNEVLPRTRLDLVSYSAWDGQDDPKTLRAALDFIASKMPDSRPFGDKNVYVGEFGKPENEFGQKKVRATVQGVVEVAVDWGCPYVVYWQLYCNEPRRRPVSSNADVRGFWLIRPDGSRSGTWHFLRGLFERGG